MKFSWIAEDYFQNSQFQYDHAKLILSRYGFKGNESVLDVGCGDGKITSEIAKKLPHGHIIGLDSSEHMVNFAKTEFENKCQNLSFILGNAVSIPFENEFDLVVSFACLHWVKDQISFLISSRNALKKNGKIILTLYPKHNLIWDSIEEATLLPKWREYFINYENPHISYDTNIYQELCKKANLKIDYLEEQEPIAYFKSIELTEAFLHSWLPHTDQIHPHLRNKFISDIINIFLKKIYYKNSNNLIGVPFRRLDAILTKF